jgi:hypothetical protein
VVAAFHQGVRDEKVLEKLTTHDVQDVSALFGLADMCFKAVEGHAWHSPVTQVAMWESKPNVGAQAQGGSNSNKKKKASDNQALAGVPTAAAVVAGGGRGEPKGNKRLRQLSNSDDGSTKRPVHNSMRHSMLECREIKKLAEQFCDKMQQQQCQDGTSSRQPEGKQKMDP